MTKILFIAHHFPPIGGAGVQRALAFVKHLPACDFKPLVLTGAGQLDGRWTPEDESLMAQVSKETPIFRTGLAGQDSGNRHSRRKSALLQLGSEVIRDHQPAIVFVTMSPFADAGVAGELAKRHHLPWVADLRDPWALDEFQVHRSFWHRHRERGRMRAALASASLVIMNTPESLKRLLSSFPEFHGRATSITNGYDSDDFEAKLPQQSSGRFTIVHSGFLHTRAGLHQRHHRWQYRILGRAERGVSLLPRSHYYLMKALERWVQDDPKLADVVKVVLAGALTETDKRLVEQSSVARLVEFTGYLSHAESLRLVRGADLLFLPMQTLASGQRATIVPGKTYEYMASGRLILAAVPEGDAKDFLTLCGTAKLCEPDDVEAMVALLKDAFHRWENRTDSAANWNKSFVEQFERRRLTSLLADELNRVLEPAIQLKS